MTATLRFLGAGAARAAALACLVSLALPACSDDGPSNAPAPADAGTNNTGEDATTPDAGSNDTGAPDAEPGDTGPADGGGPDAEPPGLSECGQEVLADPAAFTGTCFNATVTYGSCATCGYTPDAEDAVAADQCVTCAEGFEIDVLYDDCSGFCVPEGSATNPVEASGCTPPDLPGELHDVCFTGTVEASACETCGFYDNAEEATGAFDCITCGPGFEIDVFFGDCTGFCVPEGTALEPISASDCEPEYACVNP